MGASKVSKAKMRTEKGAAKSRALRFARGSPTPSAPPLPPFPPSRIHPLPLSATPSMGKCTLVIQATRPCQTFKAAASMRDGTGHAPLRPHSAVVRPVQNAVGKTWTSPAAAGGRELTKRLSCSSTMMLSSTRPGNRVDTSSATSRRKT